MYLIQSNSNDPTTDDVMDWLFYLSKAEAITRFNNNTTIETLTYRVSNTNELVEATTDQGQVNSLDIIASWYRRGIFSLTENRSASKLGQEINRGYESEQVRILELVRYALQKGIAGQINSFQDNFTNKLINLSLARNAGLAIPDTLVSNSLDEIARFVGNYATILIKDIEFNDVMIPYNEEYSAHISTGVSLLKREELLQLCQQQESCPAPQYRCYQEYIDKKYELRVFYLREAFYAMAIFSQANEKTRIDFRNYDPGKPNRCVGYQLPFEIERKLKAFMHSAKLNCGSIDMILTATGDYVFLEVNPLGQFQWLSQNCNYDIERRIAELILSENE